jgi:thiol-disulfide isomerase/thioredoxin
MKLSVTLSTGLLTGLSTGLGLALLLTAGANAGIDLSRVSKDWGSYGPVGSGEVPAFNVPLVTGGRLDNTQLGGRVSVLTFWATWCGVCMTELPMFEALHQERVSDDIQVVLINREGNGVPLSRARDMVLQTASARGLHMTLAMDDGSMYRSLRASYLPHTVVVDRHGEIRHVHPGRVLQSTLESEVAELLEER